MSAPALAASPRMPLVNTKTTSAVWIGRVLSALAVLFLVFDMAVKFAGAKEAVAATNQLGWPSTLLTTLAVIQLVCLVLYLVPRTATLGAVLWTGYLGGAVASHLRVGNPLASHVLFPVYIAAILWGGLYLRDARVRNLFSPRR